MLEVNSDTEAKLKALAQRHGVTVDDVLRSLVSSSALNSLRPALNGNGKAEPSDKLAEFLSWVNRFSTEGPGLPKEALSRASIYPDR